MSGVRRRPSPPSRVARPLPSCLPSAPCLTRSSSAKLRMRRASLFRLSLEPGLRVRHASLRQVCGQMRLRSTPSMFDEGPSQDWPNLSPPPNPSCRGKSGTAAPPPTCSAAVAMRSPAVLQIEPPAREAAPGPFHVNQRASGTRRGPAARPPEPCRSASVLGPAVVGSVGLEACEGVLLPSCPPTYSSEGALAPAWPLPWR